MYRFYIGSEMSNTSYPIAKTTTGVARWYISTSFFTHKTRRSPRSDMGQKSKRGGKNTCYN